jgi:hypothetical protein
MWLAGIVSADDVEARAKSPAPTTFTNCMIKD